jgi:hypothetical protein
MMSGVACDRFRVLVEAIYVPIDHMGMRMEEMNYFEQQELRSKRVILDELIFINIIFASVRGEK